MRRMRILSVACAAMLIAVSGCGGSAGNLADSGAAAGDGVVHSDAALSDLLPTDLPQCPDPILTPCGTSCVNLQTDPQHCGGCGNACAAGQVCIQGTCGDQPADCRVEGPCAAGTYCDLADGQCKPGCAFAEDCGQLADCDTSTNTCFCLPGAHDCSGVCVSNEKVTSCGDLCSPCPVPANGQATCDGQSCGMTCNGGYHLCGSSCANNNSVATCGSSCSPCPVPANGQATCDGQSCGMTCSGGFHLCGSSCVDNTSVANCGSSCSPCSTAPNAQATCDGQSCGLICDSGFHMCSGTCVDNTSVANCGSSCSPCPLVPNGQATCDGQSCGAQCDSGFHLCGGACVDNTSVATCGSSCTPCPTAPNAQATCDGQSCGLICEGGHHLCAGSCVPFSLTVETALGSPGFSYGAYNEIKVDAQDHPHLLGRYYHTGSGDSDVTLLVHDGGSWNDKPFFTYPQYSGFRMALDGQGDEHLVFSDRQTPTIGTVINTLRHGYFEADAWGTQTILSDTKEVSFGSALAVDAADGVHVVFTMTYLGSSQTYYSALTSGGPSSELIFSTSASLSLDTDSANAPVLAYGNKGLYLTRRTASGWTGETLVSPGTWTSYYPMLVLDSQDDPHIGYIENNDTLKYTRLESGIWQTETVQSNATGLRAAFALDSDSQPRLAVIDLQTPSLLYLRREGGSWSTLVVDTDPTISLAAPSLALDSQDTAYISYVAAVGTDGVIKVARIPEPSCP